MKYLVLAFGFLAAWPMYVHAQTASNDVEAQSNFMDDFDPRDPNAEQILKAYDAYYESETGESAQLANPLVWKASTGTCYRANCELWADVVRAEQRLYLYQQGQLVAVWAVSTGIPGRSTPNFDRHPDGRIYQRYTSSKFPGGNYNGLGNMPYAVFIQGGFAIHGTTRGNWKRLGHRASHGCVRIHPDNARIFNQLVRGYGKMNVWITVEEHRHAVGEQLVGQN